MATIAFIPEIAFRCIVTGRIHGLLGIKEKKEKEKTDLVQFLPINGRKGVKLD